MVSTQKVWAKGELPGTTAMRVPGHLGLCRGVPPACQAWRCCLVLMAGLCSLLESLTHCLA